MTVITARRHLWASLVLGISLIMVMVGLFVPRGTTAATGINEQMNFQARLLNAQGATVPDGTYNMQFKVYQDGDGVLGGGDETLKWTESWLNQASNGVTVRNGYFSVNLGKITAFSTNIDWNQDTLWLSMNVGNTNGSCTPFSGCSGDGEMSPFKRLTSSPYSLNSGKLGGLSSSQFVQLAQGLQVDASTSNASIAINKTGGTAGILDLQRGGQSVMQIANGGAATFRNQTDSTSAFLIQNAAGTPDTAFKVDTTNNRVYVGNQSATVGTDTTLLVVDTVPNTVALPTGVNGGIVYDANSGVSKFKVYENGSWKTLCNTTDLGCGSTVTLQTAYTASGTTEITLNNTNNGLQVDAGTATGNLLAVQSAGGGTTYLAVSSTGLAVTGTTSVSSDITTTGGNIILGNSGNATSTIRKRMAVNGTVAANDLVEIYTSADGTVTRTSGANSPRVFGVASGAGTPQDVVTGGTYQVNLISTNPAITRGDFIVSSATAGAATSNASPAAGTVIGRALENKSLNAGGTVWIQVTPGIGGSGAGGSGKLQDAYTNSGTDDPQILLDSTNGGIEIEDGSTPVSGNLLSLQSNGGSATYFGVSATQVTVNATYLQKSDSASAFKLQSTGNVDLLVFNGSTKHLEVHEGTGSNRYADIYYDNAANEAVFTASSGVTRIGSGSGNITMSLTNVADALVFQKTATLSGAYTGNDFSITRTLTQTGNSSSSSAVLKVEDLSTASSNANIAGDLLQINQNNASASGTLINAKAGGSTKFSVSVAGSTSIASGQSYTGAGAVTLSSGGATAVNVDTGGAAAINIGVSNATSINLDPVSANNNNVTIGVADGNANVLVVDSKSTSGDAGVTCVEGGIYYNSTDDQFRGCRNGTWYNLIAGVDVKNYTANDTWSKPAGVSVVMVVACGGGGSGGGGRGAAAPTARQGGTGGGGGSHVERMFSASDLTGTVAVTIGATATGGTANNNGNPGNTTTFAAYVKAAGGGRGAAGPAAAANTTGGGGAGFVTTGTAAGTSSINGGEGAGTAPQNGLGWAGGGATTGGVGMAAQFGGAGGGGTPTALGAGGAGGGAVVGGGGGGGGGSVTAASPGVASAGGAGGGTGIFTSGSGGTSGSGANGGAGAAGTSAGCGTGGGGGGSANAATGFIGGAGGTAGGGGGGGGGGTSTGGAGGDGGRGEMWVFSW